MNEPRTRHEYGARETDAARRVLVDLGQVLGSWFTDGIVVVGGWVPDLLLAQAEEPHIGSIDVDLALDAKKLSDGRYAEIVKLLLGSGRYQKTDHSFDNAAEGIEALALDWRERRDDPLMVTALAHLRDKFATLNAYGPRQVAIFYDATTREDRERHIRRSYELVTRFLEVIGTTG